MLRKRGKQIFYLIIAFFILTIASYIISEATNSVVVQEFVEKLGILAPLFIVAGIAIGGIIVPLSALPFLLASIPLYGYWLTFFLYYIGNTLIAPSVDYYIAKKLGRPAVTKLAGRKAIKEIDKMTSIIGWQALIPLRLFGGILFDSISYAIGLTNINFKKSMIITAIFSIPGHLIILYLIDKGITSSPLYFAIIVIWGFIAGLLTPYLIYKWRFRHSTHSHTTITKTTKKEKVKD